MSKFDFDNTEDTAIEIESALKLKLASYKMALMTREETYQTRENRAKQNGREFPSAEDKKIIKMLNVMIEDYKQEAKSVGGTDEMFKEIEEEVSRSVETKTAILDRTKLLETINDKKKETEDATEVEQEETNPEPFEIKYKNTQNKINKTAISKDSPQTHLSPVSNTEAEITNKKSLFDTIPLPSKGECYTDKKTKIPVAYLTAYDENLIVSPNLYDDGTFIDVLLKNKIMYKDFNPDNLLPGDRDAIILWLRASGYGSEFPVTATDNATGKQFDTTVDLSAIKYKPFTLKGDENGYFDFTMPVSKDQIKFRFLTYGLLKKLEEMNEEKESKVKGERINTMLESISKIIKNDTNIDDETEEKLNDSVDNLSIYGKSLSERNENTVVEAITNRLVLSIVSVNGNSNADYIKDYVRNMAARDSYALRSYITKNEPGVDFNVKVKRPKSLGGGSVSMFLTLDQFLFFSIVE